MTGKTDAKMNPIDEIAVKSPCDEPWEEMKGDNTKRHCSSCDKSVYNLSEMSREDANRLLIRKDGKICIRFARTADGELVSKQAGIYQIARRNAGIATGVVALGLSLSSVTFAQGGVIDMPPPQESRVTLTKLLKISKTRLEVRDSSNQLLPGATLTIQVNEEKKLMINADDKGMIRVTRVDDGIYRAGIKAKNYHAKLFDLEVSSENATFHTVYLEPDYAAIGRTTPEGKYRNPVFNSIADGDWDQFQKAVASGFDANSREDGTTALMVALKNSEYTIAKKLIELEANIHDVDPDGNSILNLLAADFGEDEEEVIEILRILLKNGAYIDHKDSEGETPLIDAAYYNDHEAIEILLNAGANAAILDNDDFSAYKAANEKGKAIFRKFGIFR